MKLTSQKHDDVYKYSVPGPFDAVVDTQLVTQGLNIMCGLHILRQTPAGLAVPVPIMQQSKQNNNWN